MDVEKQIKDNFIIPLYILNDGLVTIELIDSCHLVVPVDSSLAQWRNFEYKIILLMQ